MRSIVFLGVAIIAALVLTLPTTASASVTLDHLQARTTARATRTRSMSRSPRRQTPRATRPSRASFVPPRRPKRSTPPTTRP